MIKNQSNLTSKGAIGIFDSGVGGLTIWKEISVHMPNENTVFLADSANAPYGEKSKAEILDLCIKNTEILLGMGCKIIVVACNTATTNAIAYLRKTYPVPFIGIEPAIKPAALQSKTGKIGVLATKGTLSSDLFAATTKTHTQGIQLYEQEGVGLVERIEKGDYANEEVKSYLKEMLQPMVDSGIDHLVLGCTHYPLLIPVLNEVLSGGIKLVDCGGAVARQTANILKEKQLEQPAGKQPSYLFYTNGRVAVINRVLEELGAGSKATFLEF